MSKAVAMEAGFFWSDRISMELTLMAALLSTVLIVTNLASIVFAALYAVIVHHIITLDDIPFFPRYEPVR